MKALNYKSTYGAKDEGGAANGVDSNLGLHFGAGFNVESFEAKSAELSGLAAAGSWGFAWSNLNLVAEFVALELAGVNRSSVVSARRYRGPRTDALGWSYEGKRVSNIDVDYLVPTDGNGSEWVGYDYALIKDVEFGPDENQVRSDAKCQSPQATRQGQICFFGQPEGDCKKQAQSEDQTCQEVSAARPKSLSITHVSIIAGEK